MDLRAPGELQDVYHDYVRKDSKLDAKWNEVFGLDSHSKPTLYHDPAIDDKYPPITDPNVFIDQLAKADELSQRELYLVLENSQTALATAQDEYLAITKALRRIQGSNVEGIPNPQELEDFEEYDEKKKASLYGYSFIPKIWSNTILPAEGVQLSIQNPFTQGGFVPSFAAFKKMKALAATKMTTNDDFVLEREGKLLVPRLYKEPKIPFQTINAPRPMKKRTRGTIEAEETSRPTSMEKEVQAMDPGTDKPNTRFAGTKVPLTREMSSTPDLSPTPKRRKIQLQKPSNLSATASPAPDMTPTPNRRNIKASHLTAMPDGDSPATVRQSARMRTTRSSARNTPAPSRSSLTPTPETLIPTFKPTNHGTATPATQIKKESTPMKDEKEREFKTDADLIAAIKEDDTFLHENSTLRAKWREHILVAKNPKRTHAMLKKWGGWRATGDDKRPRNKGAKKAGAPKKDDQRDNDEHHEEEEEDDEDELQREDSKEQPKGSAKEDEKKYQTEDLKKEERAVENETHK